LQVCSQKSQLALFLRDVFGFGIDVLLLCTFVALLHVSLHQENLFDLLNVPLLISESLDHFCSRLELLVPHADVVVVKLLQIRRRIVHDTIYDFPMVIISFISIRFQGLL